jgi:hypothetical protein
MLGSLLKFKNFKLLRCIPAPVEFHSQIPLSCPVKRKSGTTVGRSLWNQNLEWSPPPYMTNNRSSIPYVGNYLRGQRSGFGVARFPNGSVYEGEWDMSNRTGLGTLRIFDKDCMNRVKEMYTGEWLNNLQHGRGTYYCADGSIYTGEWAYGKKEGEGVYEYANGHKTMGIFKNNLFCDGFGSMLLPSGDVYKGDWENGTRHGQGTLVSSNGSCYEGEWREGKKHGKGVLRNADGSTLSGEFRSNRVFNSSGSLLFDNGDLFVGTIVNGFYEGEGVLRYADGRKYEGNWLRGKQTGLGTFTNADGTCWTGQYNNGRPYNGVGVVVHASGDVFEGSLLAGKPQNYGTYRFACGAHYVGMWEKGKMHGQGKYTYVDGAVWEGIYSNGDPYTGFGTVRLHTGETYHGKLVRGKKLGIDSKEKLNFLAKQRAVLRKREKLQEAKGNGKFAFKDSVKTPVQS